MALSEEPLTLFSGIPTGTDATPPDPLDQLFNSVPNTDTVATPAHKQQQMEPLNLMAGATAASAPHGGEVLSFSGTTHPE